MNKVGLITAALIAALPVAALAQTCASPIALSGQQSYTGNTTTSTDQMSTIAGVASPGNEIVYSFTANNVATTANITVTSVDYDWAIYLTKTCVPNIGGGDLANAQAGSAGTGGTMPMNFGGAALTNGTVYYVIMSGEPGGATTSGNMTFNTPKPLPVSLKSFSVK